MAGTIYANARDHDRDLAIYVARAGQTAAEVANQFGISAGAVRAVVRRLKAERTYELFIERKVDGTRQRIATVITHKGFTAACVGDFREFGEFFRGLELPGWTITDGTSCNTLETVRKIAARTADRVVETRGSLL